MSWAHLPPVSNDDRDRLRLIVPHSHEIASTISIAETMLRSYFVAWLDGFDTNEATRHACARVIRFQRDCLEDLLHKKFLGTDAHQCPQVYAAYAFFIMRCTLAVWDRIADSSLRRDPLRIALRCATIYRTKECLELYHALRKFDSTSNDVQHLYGLCDRAGHSLPLWNDEVVRPHLERLALAIREEQKKSTTKTNGGKIKNNISYQEPPRNDQIKGHFLKEELMNDIEFDIDGVFAEKNHNNNVRNQKQSLDEEHVISSSSSSSSDTEIEEDSAPPPPQKKSVTNNNKNHQQQFDNDLINFEPPVVLSRANNNIQSNQNNQKQYTNNNNKSLTDNDLIDHVDLDASIGDLLNNKGFQIHQAPGTKPLLMVNNNNNNHQNQNQNNKQQQQALVLRRARPFQQILTGPNHHEQNTSLVISNNNNNNTNNQQTTVRNLFDFGNMNMNLNMNNLQQQIQQNQIQQQQQQQPRQQQNILHNNNNNNNVPVGGKVGGKYPKCVSKYHARYSTADKHASDECAFCATCHLLEFLFNGCLRDCAWKHAPTTRKISLHLRAHPNLINHAMRRLGNMRMANGNMQNLLEPVDIPL